MAKIKAGASGHNLWYWLAALIAQWLLSSGIATQGRTHTMYISVTQRAGTSKANAPKNTDDEINFRRVAEFFCDFFDGGGVETLPKPGDGECCSVFSSSFSSFTFVEGEAQRGLALLDEAAAPLVAGIL